MRFVQKLRLGISGLLLVSAGCSELGVRHPTAPDIEQVFATSAAIEQTIGTGYQSCHNAVQTLWGDGLLPQMSVLALEGYGTVANLGVGQRVGIPRAPVINTLGSLSIYSDYRELALGGRLAANALRALERLTEGGRSLGTAAQDLRARAFGYFALGCHQGWLAMAYDSVAIVHPGLPSDSIPPLSGATDAMLEALAALDTAIIIAQLQQSQGTGGFPIPAAWLGGNQLSASDFVRLVRSMRARFRVGVARTPDERAAVLWQEVVADAEAGLGSDFMVAVAPGTWVPGGNVNSGFFNSVTPFYHGMADVSGGYDAWLATPLNSRSPFLIVTPDRRWPQGASRPAQIANSAVPSNFSGRPYFANRSGADPPAHPWAESYYYFHRLFYITLNNLSGFFPAMTKAEVDLLAAEGYLRLGNVAAAAAKIDLTRVARGELPPLTGFITALDQAVPGGSQCVPRVPAPPAYTSTQCGTIWEAMKWEKRMETAFTGYGQWFFDSRGWGDLVENTAVEFPVPVQEMLARQKVPYSLGGGMAGSAPRGTYGF